MEIINIEEALKFYNIDDNNYKNNCYDCLCVLKENQNLLNEFNQVFNILFINKNNEIRKLWKYKNIKELFKEKIHNYITNLLLLSGYKIHKKNIEYYNLDEEQINISKNRVRECLTNDIYLRGYEEIRISQMVWGAYFINFRLIEVGRLQYEKYDNNIKIHIPPNEKLEINKVKQSLIDSKNYMEKYFKIKDYNYYCDSWLLSKQIHNLVDKDSNIYKFYELFSVEEGNSCIDDVLNFVYQLDYTDDYINLKEDTKLQRIIKRHLLDGNDIKIGKGVLK